jgi:hypothetical protein
MSVILAMWEAKLGGSGCKAGLGKKLKILPEK